MSAFEKKWQEAARAARARSPEVPAMPFGFAARVAALSREAAEPVITWLSSFERFVYKALALVAVLVCITGGLVAREMMEPPSIVPAIEDEVAEQFPLL